MERHHKVIVVGSGQAGLSTSYLLKKKGIDHIVFDRGKIGDTWRLKRWDSFCLVTQNWQCQLPGFPYEGDDPEGFMAKDDIIKYIESYAASFNPPVLMEVEVKNIYFDKIKKIFVAETSVGTYFADNIVIAAGTYQHNRLPDFCCNLHSEFKQLHSSEYKNPGELPEGGVLVVGSGQSGCQISEDLKDAGRNVSLSVGGAPRIPRRYRGKDILQWADLMGMYDMPIDKHPEGKSVRFKTHPHVSGRDRGRTINLRQLALDGIKLYGRMTSINGAKLNFKDNLKEILDKADKEDEKIKKTIDEFIVKKGMEVPHEIQDNYEWEPDGVASDIDLHQEKISTIIWATGYKYDYSWVDLPVFDENGYPVYERGITDIPGLYFVGLHWMHTWGSGLFYSVGRDAEYITEHINQQKY